VRYRFPITLALAIALLAAGCGGGEAEGGDCGAAPAAMSGSPNLPSGFPTPEGVTYTEEREAGPSTIVDGYREADLGDTFEDYKSAFDDAGYDVTNDEKERDDAEVNFAGGGTDGQVKLREECAGRTTISITVRPA
jgi:hypothetical protein